jgi:hypothetical protein
MNEKIKPLADKAGFYIPSASSVAKLEIFAQLIMEVASELVRDVQRDEKSNLSHEDAALIQERILGYLQPASESVKTDYRVKIYKKDARFKSGENLVESYQYLEQTPADLKYGMMNLRLLFPSEKGFRIESYEKWITVRNLMTGSDIMIDADTPWSCRPDSEAYWSN